MSDVLWNDIDAYLQTHLLADLGPASALYTTLLVTEVKVGERLDLDHVTAPALFVYGRDADYSGGPHGDGDVHTDTVYPYTIGVLASGASITVAVANVKTILRRVRTCIEDHHGLAGLTASDGETVSRTHLIDAYALLRGPAKGTYLGLGALSLEVYTEK